jgi:primosomal protein N' (replication factor Y)
VPGEVLIQTCTPDHPAITAAVLGDERGWVEREMSERRELGYPPFRRIASLRFQGPDEAKVEAMAGRVAAALRERVPEGVEVLGPAPQALAKLRGQHRWHLLLKSASAKTLGEAVRRGLEAGEEKPARRGAREVRVVADVDPVDVL